MAAASGSTARGTWWQASGQWRRPCPARIQRQWREEHGRVSGGSSLVAAGGPRQRPACSIFVNLFWIFVFACRRHKHPYTKNRFLHEGTPPAWKSWIFTDLSSSTCQNHFWPVWKNCFSTSEVPILNYFTQLLPLIRKQVDRIKLDGDWLLKHTQTSIELRCTSANLGTTGLDTWTKVFFFLKEFMIRL